MLSEIQLIALLLAATGAPLLSFILTLLIPRTKTSIISTLSTTLMLLSTICAFVILFAQWGKPAFLINIRWFSISDFAVNADVSLARESLLMLVIVSLISFLVHLYSTAYMKHDENRNRYFAVLGFFTWSMQGVVLSNNLLLLFFFWELVGFASYILIGHWSNKIEAGQAARKAFIFNRIGDAAFMVGLMIIWSQFKTFDITELVSTDISTWQTTAGLLIFCGVVGKSAQFPLLTWLPDAMEGPTPVSALIHAATMVAAGVYLMVRLYAIFTADALMVVAVTGMITALIGAFSALTQFDIKKILAYSTISQLGLMIMVVGAGAKDAAFFHLLTHAFFKACLFLSAGCVIYAIHEVSPKEADAQDIRIMGGLRTKMPITFLSFTISGASLAGLPFFSGFLSKEAMMISLWMKGGAFDTTMLVSFAIVSFLTMLYTFRLIWSVFMNRERTAFTQPISEAPNTMLIPSMMLAVCSLWFSVSLNPFHLDGWMTLNAAGESDTLTIFSILWIVISLITGWMLFNKSRFSTNPPKIISYHLDRFYNGSFGQLTLMASHASTYIDNRIIDRVIHRAAYVQVTIAHITGWIDRALVDGAVHTIAYIANTTGGIIRSFQSGKIQLYIFWTIFTIIIFLIWALN